MKIKVGNIPEEGLEFRFYREGESFVQLLPGKEKTDFSLHGVEVTGHAAKVRQTVSLRVKVKTAMDMECSRCLEPVTAPVVAEFTCTFVPAGSKIGEGDPSRLDEDLDVGYYQDDIIDLEPQVLEQVVLQVPFKPLCREDCKGLCPHCGANLNTDACQCERGTFGHPLAALKNFKVKE